jgi:hypothetical protein
MLRLVAQASAVEYGTGGGDPLWLVTLILTIAAGVAGALSAMMSERGRGLPGTVVVGGKTVWLPGWVGSVLAGAIAAAALWSLFGLGVNAIVLITKPTNAERIAVSLRYAVFPTIFGALLVGFSAARWLSTEADKRIAQATMAVLAERADLPEDQLARVRNGSPREAAEALGTLR